MASASRFLVTHFYIHPDPLNFTLLAITDIDCILTLHFTDIQPLKYQETRLRRGVRIYPRLRFTFVPTATYNQTNPDPSKVHCFAIPSWPTTSTRWIFFTATINGLDSPSQSPIFSIPNEEAILTWESCYTPLIFDSLEAWDTSDMAGSGAAVLTSHYLQLQLGPTAPSRAHVFLRWRGWAQLQGQFPEWFRVIAQFHNLPLLADHYLTLGSSWAGPNQFGFYVTGQTIYGYTRNPMGLTTNPISTLTEDEQSVILEARHTPNQNVLFYVNGAYAGSINTTLPGALGYGPDFYLESDTATNTWLRIFRAEVLRFGWSPIY